VKIEQAKADIATALPLTNGPGLPAGLRQYISDFSALADDIIKGINASIAGDQSTYDAAAAQLKTDVATLNAVDTANFDSSIQSFYQPRIATYEQELQQASD